VRFQFNFKSRTVKQYLKVQPEVNSKQSDLHRKMPVLFRWRSVTYKEEFAERSPEREVRLATV